MLFIVMVTQKFSLASPPEKFTMPVRTVPGTDIQYHLICFDANGVERPEKDGSILSAHVISRLASATDPISDVFFCSHGWQGDVPGAIAQYDRWVGVMAASTDFAVAKASRPGFSPLVVGVHWPSLPYGDENLPEAGVLSVDDATQTESQVDSFAATISNSQAARDAIRLILTAAKEDDGERETLPEHVRSAYELLALEAALPEGGSNPGGPPGEEMGEWDADAIYADAREIVKSDSATEAEGTPGLLGGGFFDKLKGLVVAPLQQLSFWKMKDRARSIGEGGVHSLLIAMQEASTPATQFHLMGHSFGCIVMSATVAGSAGGAALKRPVDSLFLVQGALSLWSFSPNIPIEPGKVGYFNRILAEHLVRGPIVTTQSSHDTAVGKLYPAAVIVKSQFLLGDEYPKYGGIGTYGIQGVGDIGQNLEMFDVTHDYGFKPGLVYNLESSAVIKTSSNLASGAHSDIAHPEVAHAFWQAVFHSTL